MKNQVRVLLLLVIFSFLCEYSPVRAQQNKEDSIRYHAFYQKNFYTTQSVPAFFTTEIPFEEISGAIVVEVLINGIRYHFLFDTGAITAFSKELSEKIQLPVRDSLTVYDGNRKGFVQLIHQAPVAQIGAITFNNIGFINIDLKTISSLLCKQIDGIIGATWMRYCQWKIDFKRKVLYFSNQPLFLQTPEMIIPFQENREGGLPMVTGSYTSRKVTFLFDSGNTGEINLPTEAFPKLKKMLKKFPHRVGHGIVSYSVYGSTEGDKYELSAQNFFLDGTLFGNRKLHLQKGLQPLIGTKFMRDYIVSLDWTHHQIGLTPNEFSAGKADSTFGFSAAQDSAGLFVSFIWEGSEADKKGLKVGDRILTIAGAEKGETASNYCEFASLTAQTATLNLKVERGSRLFKEWVLHKQPVNN